MRRTIAAALLLTCSQATSQSAIAHPGHGGLAPGAADAAKAGTAGDAGRRWLAGDHHIHSEFSVDYAPRGDGGPPLPLLGKDGRYSITRNAEMARRFGLGWMVATDHGGPLHSKVDRDQAYPQVLAARAAVPGILIFYGMEFDTPGADHSSLIVPRTDSERDQLFRLETRYSKREPWPADKGRDTEPFMLDALKGMAAETDQPVLIANHPSRSATGVGAYGQTRPAELRDWNDTAPTVAIGMEGAPGHQAGALKPDGSPDPEGARGGYRNAPTMGGFDQMTARLGGFWDSMLGEGRRWWITATSDSHANWRDGGNDFWPGEYAKTWVKARASHADILDGLRHGRVFVATGDLVTALDVTVAGRAGRAGMGGELPVAPGETITVTIRLTDPAAPNAGGRTPAVARVDLIAGDVGGPVADRAADRNASTRVVRRFGPADWQRQGEVLTMTHRLVATGPLYLRVRGTAGSEAEPLPDPRGEDPWSDLWFYGNPVFVTPKDRR